jgi:hypothetical protein
MDEVTISTSAFGVDETLSVAVVVVSVDVCCGRVGLN